MSADAAHAPLALRQHRLIAKYQLIEDPHERLAAIVAHGRKWPSVPADAKTEAHRVVGCVSPVWLVGRMEAGHCRFALSAESPMVQGLAALLCELYDDARPADIVGWEPGLFQALGLARQLSPTRLQGLANLRRVIREFAHEQIS